jgi:transcription initiation factor TFIIH subunit 1
VLVKNPQLAALHYELVQSGQITDEEFWEGREVRLESRRRAIVRRPRLTPTVRPCAQLLLTSESLSSHQRPGRSSQLIDDRWTSSSKSSATTSGTGQGTTKAAQKGNAMGTISLTPELIRDIFDEFPDVHLAWKQNVPKVRLHPLTCGRGSTDASSPDNTQVVTEPVFWQRYFNSRLWERHRASARTSGGKGTAKEDEMFDKYLGEVDDGPFRPRVLHREWSRTVS